MEEVTSEINFSWDMEEEAAERALQEQMWKSRTGLNEGTLCGAIEALIFMSEKPLSIQKIKKAIDEDLPLRLIHDSIDIIQKSYQTNLHGIRLTEVAEGYQFRTKIQFSKYIQNIHKAPTISLSPLALEVLAIVAFKQPISKMEVDQMRGVDSGHVIRGLMDKGLVKVLGKSDEAGNPATYGTSDTFLELFNVNTLEDLPSMNDLLELVEKNSIGDIENIKEIVKSDKEKFLYDEIDELDQLREEIKSVEAHTEFTKLLKENSKAKKKDSVDGEPVETKTSFDILEDFVAKPTEDQAEFEIESEVASIETEEKLEGALFDNEEELENMLEAAFQELKFDDDAKPESFVSEESIEEDKVDESDDEDLDGSDFEISDLGAIQQKLNDFQDDDLKS